MQNSISTLLALPKYINRNCYTLPIQFHTLLILFLLLSISTYSAPKKSTRETELIQECLGFEKRPLVSQNMNLNVLDQRRFWPIYEGYEKDRTDLVEKRLMLIEKYIGSNNETTEIELELIHTQRMSVEKKLQEVQIKVFETLKKEFGIRVALRFTQIDDHITATITLHILNIIPIKGALTKEERLKLEEERSKNNQ